MDIICATLFLLGVFSWLYPLIALFIRLNSKGKALFVQERIGLNGKHFKCYKFRTLEVEPSNAPQPIDWLIAENLHVTRIGKLLRRYNLDELPQFINVLIGNMSLVGPRPHALPFHEKYATYIADINQRLLVKPGITGLAQIKGYRGDVSDEALNRERTLKRVYYDIAYIQNWTFFTDIHILIATVLPIGR